ncbi:MAG: 5-(carboxyamino)imidazole ribonucleotide mutase [Beduini sp.]
MKVAIVMGSVSDLPKLTDAIDFLKGFGVEVSVRALSAHRAHEALSEFLKETENDGTEVIIAAAGKAAHLPGVIASQTIKPVIGVPIKGSALDGMDALLSIVQMPAGIPVATVAIDGAKNAAILAVQMMAIHHQELKEKLLNHRQQMRDDALKANDELVQRYK